MPNRDLSELRKNYQFSSLDIKDCTDNPFQQFQLWLNHALEDNLYEPNGMQLATVGKNGIPSVRTLLLKEICDNGFVFFTNFESKKGMQIEQNNHAAMVFWWREHERQVRIEGVVEKYDIEKSKKYFYSRPQGSQLAASISPQSKKIPNRKYLDDLYEQYQAKYSQIKFPFPKNWGGYKLVPTLFEFWQGRESRLHDRIEYIYEENTWTKHRLAP
jgi:pyridoxamine 5'-phosphate oxidase